MAQNVYRITSFLKVTTSNLQNVRLYCRWAHRRPAKVILPFEQNSTVNLKKEKVIDLSHDPLKEKINVQKKDAELDNVIVNEIQEDTSHKRINSKEIKEKKETKLKKINFYLSQKKVFNDNGEIMYEKLKENDSRISSLLVNLKSKKERQRKNQILVEGWRMIIDGLESKCKLKYIIFSQVPDLQKLHSFLPNTGAQIFKIPYKEIEKWSDLETPPGILGVFDIPTEENIKRLSPPLPITLICDNVRVPGNLGAILRVAVGVGCDSVLLTKGCVDVWDPKVIRSGAGAHFRQPIYTSVEWEELPKLLNPNTSLFIADSNSNVDKDDCDTSMMSQIPVSPYYGVEFSNLKHVTLVIGGETEGISEESYSFAQSKNGLRLNIPLQKGVDSLNTGMAAAVIAFEIRKQFLHMLHKEKLERPGKQIT